MAIDRIHLFILTAKHLNISQAARELRTTQSTASRQLKQFQEELGTKLFKESGRGIELTKSGRVYLNEVSPIFLQLEALQKKYIRTKESLAIACNHDVSMRYMPFLITQFSQKHPSVQLTLHVGSSAEIEELLLASRVDLAIITNLSTSSSSLFTMEPFRRDSLVAFVSANHSLAQNDRTLSARISEIPLVIRFRRDGQGRTETELNRLVTTGMRFKIAVRCESAESVKGAVRLGAGVGILYHDIIKRELDQGEFKVVNVAGFDVVGQSHIVYSEEKPLSAPAREFLALLRASVKQNPAIKTISKVSYGRNDGQDRDHILRSKLLY